MPVVDRGDAALAMVLNSIHGVPAKAKRVDLSAVRAPEIMGCHLLGDAELRADGAHERSELRRIFTLGNNSPVQQSLRRLRQPHAMALAILGARPACGWLARHFPPAIDDVLGAHMPDLAGTLPGEQDELERNPG